MEIEIPDPVISTEVRRLREDPNYVSGLEGPAGTTGYEVDVKVGRGVAYTARFADANYRYWLDEQAGTGYNVRNAELPETVDEAADWALEEFAGRLRALLEDR